MTENGNTSNTRRIRTRRSVRFDDRHNEVHDVENFAEDADMAQDLWMDQADFLRSVTSYKDAVAMLNEGKLAAEEMRGLEFRTSNGARARLAKRNSITKAVLDELERQWEACDDVEVAYDFEAIAGACAELSRTSAESALRLAVLDEWDAYGTTTQGESVTTIKGGADSSSSRSSSMRRSTYRLHRLLRRNQATLCATAC